MDMLTIRLALVLGTLPHVHVLWAEDWSRWSTETRSSFKVFCGFVSVDARKLSDQQCTVKTRWNKLLVKQMTNTKHFFPVNIHLNKRAGDSWTIRCTDNTCLVSTSLFGWRGHFWLDIKHAADFMTAFTFYWYPKDDSIIHSHGCISVDVEFVSFP